MPPARNSVRTLPAPALVREHAVVPSPTAGEPSPERMAFLALALTPGLGPRRVLRMVREAGSAMAVLASPLTALEGMQIPAAAARSIAEGRALAAAAEEARRLEAEGAGFLCHWEDAYPERLRQIYDAPPVLWVRGDVSLLGRPGIAVVGTRSPSPYGSGMAELLSRDLATRNLLILSGMARGIDACAHKGAIASGKPTLAVWGTGIDVIYPKENKVLAQQILATGGCIVSEQPLGTYPAPPNFPKRNRILSALSVGVLVVEAAEYSGSRVTARCAVEQNRDVYAVPGNVTNKNSWGPNSLIRAGAKLVASWEDVWDELPVEVRVELEATLPGVDDKPAGTAATLFEDPRLPPNEARILGLVRHDEAVQLDDLMERLEGEMTSPEVFTALFELELSGKIRQMPGKNYVRTF